MKRNLAFLLILIVVLSGVGAIPFYDATNKNDVGGDIEEIENAFLEKDSIDVLVWLKDNKYTSPEYQENLDKKRVEIRKIQDKVLSELNEDEFELIAKFEVTNGIAGSITKKGFEELKKNKYVDSIYMDRVVYVALAESRPLIKADMVERRYRGTGEGVTVCVLDTGVDYTHPALADNYVGGFDFVNSQDNNNDGDYDDPGDVKDDDPMDDEGHGTHVSGIIASSDMTYRGIAPGASLAAVKVLDASGRGSDFKIALGIDWCINNAQNFNIKIITMSIGDGRAHNDGNCPPILNPFIQNAINAGLFLDAASGNQGLMSGVSHPACAPGVASVGAVYDANVGSNRSWWREDGQYICSDSSTNSDKIVCFTNRGLNLDLLAPGAIIKSTASSVGRNCGANPNGGFRVCSGTSMAAPHVAGVAALLFEKDSSLTPSEIEFIMEDTGKIIFDSGTGEEFPRVNAFAAVSSIVLKRVELANFSRFP